MFPKDGNGAVPVGNTPGVEEDDPPGLGPLAPPEEGLASATARGAGRECGDSSASSSGGLAGGERDKD